MTARRVAVAVAALFSGIILAVTACTGTPATAPPAPTLQSAPNPTLNSITTVTPTPSTLTGTQQITRVFDGDTLYARLAGDDVPVRFIGINAPEVVHPNHPQDDCLGPEARALARALLAGGVATLSDDSTQGDKDRYGRFLRYVNTAPPDQDVALTLLSEGLAREYTYRKPYARQAAYREAEAEARTALRGGWAAPENGGCGWS